MADASNGDEEASVTGLLELIRKVITVDDSEVAASHDWVSSGAINAAYRIEGPIAIAPLNQMPWRSPGYLRLR